MKVYQLIDRKYMGILSDELSKQIIFELIKRERTPMELMKILKKPILAIWKRLNDMSSAKVVEVVGIKRRIGGPLMRIYRASAVIYLVDDFVVIYPDKYSIFFNIFKDLNIEFLKNLEKYNQIPNGVDPIKYAALAFLRAFTETLKNRDFLDKKLSEIEELLNKIKL